MISSVLGLLHLWNLDVIHGFSEYVFIHLVAGEDPKDLTNSCGRTKHRQDHAEAFRQGGAYQKNMRERVRVINRTVASFVSADML